ncbi:glycosyltransferase [Runella slithyformis]|uniref:Glycosyl transferase family 2 n=1 Tax=Runella slithyformis (strain ATCC 29530 / DSM 19594 / LMG 11500 / NCIMB 11436 / LSU 4) TaxID=761193 RepID=A0A7U3ZLW7_RUNSL|nr:glycosyltransferase family 2 protein [Runella slithyformis]AEI49611.1 glycosyl transferase family 2 [Runella slithyformis DSM 19594]
MKEQTLIKPPTRQQLFTLRLMILLGVLSMAFFMTEMMSESVRGNGVLYAMLMTTFFFACLTTLYEWYHYFSITVPKAPPAGKTYTVDIFTTFCAGEPYEMIEQTLRAVVAITYPHTSYLCDEADDPYLRRLCSELGVRHVTRLEKNDAKAGNINNALRQSSGELCVVLDPDHIPSPDFLDPIVPYFHDSEIGFVQIVQAYSNSEESLIAKGAAQQTYQFYGPMMMTMNHYGTVMAIGANCTFRREALESIGGHAAGLAEDMHTAMQLHAKGWKSVYVPRILARGLVPSTLSAYYQQQLKWSRGVFDLLVNVYPKLFTQFTLRQKIHYAFIPLHYLSGIIFFLNFLIPILSLCFAVSPLKIGIADFGLTALPFLTVIVLIRQFVQWWVTEDTERGFHVIGGILMIGTWWVFMLGFLYTLFGVKVPYLPTPKNGIDTDNRLLNIPNLIILFLSLFSIGYGLYTDWNPYNLTMSIFAGLNAAFMGLIILLSKQPYFWALAAHYRWLNSWLRFLHEAKGHFWIIRRQIYTVVRHMPLFLCIILTCPIIFLVQFQRKAPPPVVYKDYRTDFFLTGIDVSSVNLEGAAFPLSRKDKTRFDCFSFHLRWGSGFVSTPALDTVYHQGAFPMITWRLPSRSADDIRILERIVGGQEDEYLLRFCRQFDALKRPVFVCFAPEAGTQPNPAVRTSEAFRAAWRYIHDFFNSQGVYQVIWVWNSATADSIDNYFPGRRYVDWIAVSSLTKARGSLPVKKQYWSFHKHPVFQMGLPVMLIENENCSLSEKELKSIRTSYAEIKGAVIDGRTADSFGSLRHIYKKTDKSDTWMRKQNRFRKVRPESISKLLASYPAASKNRVLLANPSDFLNTTRGINYTKAQDWTNSITPLRMSDLMEDFNEMKTLGINTVKHSGPGIYDRNIVRAAEQTGMKVNFSFWMDDHLDFVEERNKLEQVRMDILEVVSTYKDHKNIIGWNIGNAVFQELPFRYFKPDLIIQQDAYLSFVKELVHSIRKIDPSRPVTIDVALAADLPQTVEQMHRLMPEVQAYGIILKTPATEHWHLLRELEVPYFFSSISVAQYAALGPQKMGVFIANWQDEFNSGLVSFDGIKDFRRRNKTSLFQLRHLWKGTGAPTPPPTVKILKPALVTIPSATLTYHALLFKENKWYWADSLPTKLRFEWRLVQIGGFEQALSIKELGNGPKIGVQVPEDPSGYRLYLYVVSGTTVVDIIHTTLNTPLVVYKKTLRREQPPAGRTLYK